MCDSSLVLPGNVVCDHSLSQPMLLCVMRALEAHDVGRPCGLKVFAKLFHDWAEWILATLCLRTSVPLSGTR